MIYCVECGTANDAAARFCTKCGVELYVPEELQIVEIPEQEVVVQPKKRGRKPKAVETLPLEQQETPIEIEENQETNEDSQEDVIPIQLPELPEAIETVQVVEADPIPESTLSEPEVISGPEALEWSDNQPPTSRYVAPVMPKNNARTEESYATHNVNPYIEQLPKPPVPRVVNTRIKPISTAGYFWLFVLYSIPGIGFIVSIILAVAPSNQNLKSFSRASLIYRIIGYTLLLIVFLMLVVLWQHFDWSWCSYIPDRYIKPNWYISIW